MQIHLMLGFASVNTLAEPVCLYIGSDADAAAAAADRALASGKFGRIEQCQVAHGVSRYPDSIALANKAKREAEDAALNAAFEEEADEEAAAAAKAKADEEAAAAAKAKADEEAAAAAKAKADEEAAATPTERGPSARSPKK